MNDPKYIIIHCSDVSKTLAPDQFKSIDNYHRSQGFPLSSLGYYVGYHSLITGGKNYKCREDREVGAHCNQQVEGRSMNFQSLGVCIGFDGDVEFPDGTQYQLLQAQVWEWQNLYNIPNDRVKLHREFALNKTCPGSLITKSWLNGLLEKPTPITKPLEQCVKQEAIIKEQENKIGILQGILSSIKDRLSSFFPS